MKWIHISKTLGGNMTRDQLIKANNLKCEIEELEDFISAAEKTWTGKLIKKNFLFMFESNAYGIYGDKVFNMKTEIKEKVLEVLREYLLQLKKQLDDL